MPCSDPVHEARWSSQDPGRRTPPPTLRPLHVLSNTMPTPASGGDASHLSPQPQDGECHQSGGPDHLLGADGSGPCRRLCSRLFGASWGCSPPCALPMKSQARAVTTQKGCQLLICTETPQRLLVPWTGGGGGWGRRRPGIDRTTQLLLEISGSPSLANEGLSWCSGPTYALSNLQLNSQLTATSLPSVQHLDRWGQALASLS